MPLLLKKKGGKVQRQEISSTSPDRERVYIRMVHAPNYRSFLPEIYFRGITEIHAGRETVDIIIGDPDEMDDPTIIRGITIHGSPRVPRLVRELIKREKKEDYMSFVDEVMGDFLSVLNSIGNDVLEENGLGRYKPFVVIETTPKVLEKVFSVLVEPYFSRGPDRDFGDARQRAKELLLQNSRMVVVAHSWRDLDSIYEEANEICRQRIKPPRDTEDYDAWNRYDAEVIDCIVDEASRIIEKERPDVGGAVYLVNGRVVARGRDVLKYARDLLPAYETSKLKTL